MNRQALVGLFTVVALIALFGVFVVLANLGPQGRYKIGVHFKSAAGLHKGALVYESGVVVGVVDHTELLPEDFTVDVILAIDNNVDVPRNAKFLIQAPLTGDSSLEIVPPPPPPKPAGMAAATNAPEAVAILPHTILPLDQQPQGTNPATIQDLLDQGQGEVRRLDQMLAQLEKREPALLNTLQSALNNANDLTTTANQQIQHLATRIDTLTGELQVALEHGSSNINDLTARLDDTVKRNSGKVDSLLASLDASARSLNATADSVQQLAQNPQLRQNLLDTTRGIAETATTIASLANDLRQVTGNPQTQAQLRDTIANVDAATQKANSILGSLGGTSSVYGIDKNATPAPVPPSGRPPRPGEPVPPAVPPSAGSRRGGPSPNPATVQANVKNKLGDLVRGLVSVQLRVSELENQRARTASSPLLTKDTGPSTDINMILFPRRSTWLFTGPNDIGGPSSSWNFAAMAAVGPHLQVGGGVLYSRLGARAIYNPGLNGVGFETRIYDPRWPTVDGYLNLKLGNGLQLFGGERDALHSGRRTTFGFQYNF